MKTLIPCSEADPTQGDTPETSGQNSSSGSRRSFLKLGFGVSASSVFAGSMLTACGGDGGNSSNPAASAPKTSSFTIAVLPDTQFYSRYATLAENQQFSRRYGSEPYLAQTTWTATHAAMLNTQFLIHLGDVVDQASKSAQWQVASTAMQTLEAFKLPYSILAGNHDILSAWEYNGDQSTGTDAQRTLTSEPYLQWFPTSRAQTQSTFGGRDTSGFHEYHIFTAQGQKFLVLSLSWRISDAGITWARGVIAANPTLPVILVSHQLLNIANDGVSPLETDYGLMLWEKLIRDNDQIFMTLNGHNHGAAHLTKTNNFGNAVEEMVVDYQMDYQGGNALMRLYEFDLTNNLIKVLSFSPWVPEKPSATVNSYDQAVLTDSNQQFVISMNFAQRFARFNPNFSTGTATISTPLVDQAKAIILANYTEPAATQSRAASNTDDYPKIASTLAHWRFFGGTAGGTIPVGTVIKDETGNNPLMRDALNTNGVTGATEGDIVWSSDHHRLSATPGSVQFLNTDKNVPRLSYFLTQANAALNAQTLTQGYTIEAFIKIDKNWAASKQAWMNIMTRDGKRGSLSGYSGGDPESPPLLFAISSLREVQWEVVPDISGTRSPATNWSGEIMPDTWIHIAIVNDPSTHDTVMYIEGAPVLRNVSNVTGIATLSASSQWVIGGGSWDGQRADGFFGNIGEIRIVPEALPASKWLTARAS